MNWRLKDDDTAPLITAEAHVRSGHGTGNTIKLPKMCVIFEMGAALPHIEANYDCTVPEKLPCFLGDPTYLTIKNVPGVCFVRGGLGAPAAVDTLETVRAMGVEKIIVAGMCGGFGGGVKVGDVVIPSQVYSEEGTSFHYFQDVKFCQPDAQLYDKAVRFFEKNGPVFTSPIVTTDAVYRQTFAKEAVWRDIGCIGVDMETSALLNVAKYYGMPAVAMHICSDRHPEKPGEDVWKWGSDDFRSQRRRFIDAVVEFVGEII